MNQMYRLFKSELRTSGPIAFALGASRLGREKLCPADLSVERGPSMVVLPLALLATNSWMLDNMSLTNLSISIVCLDRQCSSGQGEYNYMPSFLMTNQFWLNSPPFSLPVAKNKPIT